MARVCTTHLTAEGERLGEDRVLIDNFKASSRRGWDGIICDECVEPSEVGGQAVAGYRIDASAAVDVNLSSDVYVGCRGDQRDDVEEIHHAKAAFNVGC
jgi:hypothetical protein